MSVEIAKEAFLGLAGVTANGIITNGGKALANSVFPNEFEYYLMGFEVVLGSKVTDRFMMPVLPENITIDNRKILNIKKTASGISSYQNNTFEPISISLSGTFGRRFRLTTGSIKDANGVDGAKEFNLNVKTGYGLQKELERIYQKSGKLDEDLKIPYRVNFYNLAFNQSYIVEMTNLSFRQSQDKNMIWYYSLTMTAVAPADIGGLDSSFNKNIGVQVVNKAIESSINDARSLIL